MVHRVLASARTTTQAVHQAASEVIAQHTCLLHDRLHTQWSFHPKGTNKQAHQKRAQRFTDPSIMGSKTRATLTVRVPGQTEVACGC